MKRIVAFCLFAFVLVAIAKAQLHDAQWVIGPNASVIDFRNDTVTTRVLSHDIPFFLTSACISDEQGELLYTCYGSSVTDKNGDTLLNGNNLSPCAYTTDNQLGFAIAQSAIFFPKPGSSRYYYLIHFSLDTLSDTRPGTIYYSLIDREGNFGLGEVIQKNVPILQNAILRGGGLTACKHANGRDYWIIMGASVTNKFYKFLLTPDTILGPFTQNIGPNFPLPYDNAYSKFSQDGNRYVTGTISSVVLMMDFNRCSGEFSNPLSIYNEASTDTSQFHSSGSASMEFSSNGRFLYVSDRINMNQYDLWSANIQDSMELYRADSIDFAQMRMLQLAPNGKLYGSTWNGGAHFLHVINKPDELGDSCNFVYGGQPTLSANSFNLPNMINYKLGALAGSGCDTINSTQNLKTENLQARIQPNPANKYVYVEMPIQGNYIFQLMNEVGQLIEQKETKQVDVFNTENLSSGIYYLKISNQNEGSFRSAQKIIVQH